MLDQEKFYFSKQLNLKALQVSLALTIDAHLQFLVHEELLTTLENFKHKKALLLLWILKLAIFLALASYPSFDPNNPITFQDTTKNRAITESYEFGSLLKLLQLQH